MERNEGKGFEIFDMGFGMVIENKGGIEERFGVEEVFEGFDEVIGWMWGLVG